ncbi:MAG: glutaredoxin domain-containing protein [Chloroflexota bacterium]
MTEETPGQAIIVYGQPMCPMLPPVLGVLRQSDITFEYIDIRTDAQAAQRVRQINNGYASVPTLVFPDGSTLTEPSVGQLKRALEKQGFSVPGVARLWGLFWPAIGGGLFVLLVIIGQLT